MTELSSTILAFDTSGKHCAGSLLAGDNRLSMRFEAMDRGQAERLLPLLEEMLGDAGTSWDALDAIGVGVGPGNFTGIRISVSAARGLALALGIPAIGISTFEVAAAVRHGSPSETRWSGHIDIPGPRGTVYRQSFTEGALSSSAAILPPGTSDAEPFDWSSGATDSLARLAAGKLELGGELLRPAPLYIRPADAAPPKDAGPVILP